MRDSPVLPDWLPALVREHAVLLYRQTSDDKEAAAVLRVTIDPRMKGVWTFLRRRRRDEEYVRTHEYDHGARDATPNAPNPAPGRFPTRIETVQQHAMSRLYGDIVRLARRYGSSKLSGHPHLTTPHPWSEQAARLRAIAGRISAAKSTKPLIAAAETLAAAARSAAEDTAARIPAAVTVSIAGGLFQLFDSQTTDALNYHQARRTTAMPKLAATIAGVILGDTVTPDEAKHYLDALHTRGQISKKRTNYPPL
jgi:hypothetical protein